MFIVTAIKRLLPAFLFFLLMVTFLYYISKTKHHSLTVPSETHSIGLSENYRIDNQLRRQQDETRVKKHPVRINHDSLNWLYSKSESEGKNGEQGQERHEKPQKVRGEIPTFSKENILKRYPPLELGGDEKHDKWIVLTTIQEPTDDVKYLAGIDGWQVVVVGDTKTPKNWTWKNCHFIDVDFQENMGLGLTKMLSYKSYTRKNLGYLYAIGHGAKVIYETDDDNRPFDRLANFQYSKTISGLMFAGSHLFNAYQYFGQSTLWQRGYPLGKVGKEIENTFRVSRNWPRPLVQQGVVNGDPDVDAVFRLTRKYSNRKLDVTFDPASPPVILPPGVFSPTNTQNTLLHYDAFWALFIPVSLNFRTCDIWRGYITLRLMWEIGGYLAFYPPNAYQTRNNHNLVVDMSEENQMYFTTEALLEFLYKWTCPQNLSFFQCFYKLMVDMVDQENLIFVEKDINALRIWIEDIIVLGYEEPQRVEFNVPETEMRNGGLVENLKSDILRNGTPVFYAPSEQQEPKISWQPLNYETAGVRFIRRINNLCPQVESHSMKFVSGLQKVAEFLKDVLLMIYIRPITSGIKYSTIVRNIEAYYRPLFPNMVYCGHDSRQFMTGVESLHLENKQSFIEISGNSAADHVCTAKTLQMNYRVAGYLAIWDDIILDFSSITSLKKDKVWMTSHGQVAANGIPRIVGDPFGKLAYQKAISALVSDPNNSNFVANSKKADILSVAKGTVFYIPNHLGKIAEYYLTHFSRYNVTAQIAIPALLKGIGDESELTTNSKIDLFKHGRRGNSSELCLFLIENKITYGA